MWRWERREQKISAKKKYMKKHGRNLGTVVSNSIQNQLKEMERRKAGKEKYGVPE